MFDVTFVRFTNIFFLICEIVFDKLTTGHLIDCE